MLERFLRWVKDELGKSIERTEAEHEARRAVIRQRDEETAKRDAETARRDAETARLVEEAQQGRKRIAALKRELAELKGEQVPESPVASDALQEKPAPVQSWLGQVSTLLSLGLPQPTVGTHFPEEAQESSKPSL